MDTQKLIGKNIILRELRKSDISDRIACGRVDEFELMYGEEKNDAPFTVKDADNWYEKLLGRDLVWAIEYHSKCIGEVFLHQVNHEDKSARFAIGIFDKDLVGRGLGTEATMLVLDYAFNQLKLHRIELKVLAFNQRAIKSYEKAGFQKEGVKREAAFIRGKWYDDVMMSILDREFKNKP